jgi:hypothetical protein
MSFYLRYVSINTRKAWQFLRIRGFQKKKQSKKISKKDRIPTG